MQTEYAYNCIDAVTNIRILNGTEEIASSTYEYYLDGSDSCKTVSENDIIEKTSYVYNGFGQLTEEKNENGSLIDKYTYAYDDYGNRVKMTATGSDDFTNIYNYKDADNNYTALLQSEKKTGINDETDTEETAITAYTYDKNGNQLSKISNDKTENYTYDLLDQLIGYTDGETTARYTYNAAGLRASKTVNGHTIEHVWDGNQQIIADVSDGAVYSADCYFYGAGITAKYNYTSGIKSGYNYYRKNSHGDVVSITDASANNIKTYRYDAFGVEKNIDESDTNEFRYCGEYFDSETGTIYLRARYYSPETGRFTSRDSYAGDASDPLSLNVYTYCHNNPVLNFDPTGHSIWSSIKGGASKAWSGVKQWGKERVDDWKTGIGILEESGPAGQVFASYSRGVVDTLGSQVSAIRHPVQTAKAMVSGVKSFANDPVGSIKSMAIEKYNSLCDIAKDIHNGNWQSLANKAAYSLGGASVAVVEGAIGKAACSKLTSKIHSHRAAKSAKVDYRLRENQLCDNGERFATTKQVRTFKKEMGSKNVKVVVDKKGKVLGYNKAAGFCAKENTIYIGKKPVFVDMYHESFHADHCLKLGFDKYNALSTIQKESYVVKKIKDSGLFNAAEVASNERYLRKLIE